MLIAAALSSELSGDVDNDGHVKIPTTESPESSISGFQLLVLIGVVVAVLLYVFRHAIPKEDKVAHEKSMV